MFTSGTFFISIRATLRTDDHVGELPVEIVLPRGTLLTRIAGVELRPEDVGRAIQFLEFCRSFGHREVLGVRMNMDLLVQQLGIISCCIDASTPHFKAGLQYLVMDT